MILGVEPGDVSLIQYGFIGLIMLLALAGRIDLFPARREKDYERVVAQRDALIDELKSVTPTLAVVNDRLARLVDGSRE